MFALCDEQPGRGSFAPRQGQSVGQRVVVVGLTALIVDVDEVAARSDRVIAAGPLRPAMAFARAELEVLRNEGDRPVGGTDFLVTCYRWLGRAWDADTRLERVHTVGPGSLVFAEIYRRMGPNSGGGD